MCLVNKNVYFFMFVFRESKCLSVSFRTLFRKEKSVLSRICKKKKAIYAFFIFSDFLTMASLRLSDCKIKRMLVKFIHRTSAGIVNNNNSE